MYKLTVKKNVPNPNFDQKRLDEYNSDRGYGVGRSMDWEERRMEKEIAVDVLIVELNEEEFKAMKKSVIETIK